MDYKAFISVRTGEPPAPSKVVEVRQLINFEGNVFDSMDLIDALMRIWEMFIRYHTRIDTKPLVARISAVVRDYQQGKTYSFEPPDALYADAKAQADSRSRIDL